ncbi:AAA family ATPase [Vibrio harveyi]|uniref:ATP-dependent nuclease n=1 Tax=Vibrio harveyi TaxID=669 RepID=UPI001C963157|nr:ATP-binding protein [Vibrio harveyi]MBY6239243.1 AAA family ATPase [Vibrio harveyi]
MKLVNFSITNFRSITTAHKISLTETTILIGKNNEGKSNLLKGLDTAMTALRFHALKNITYYRPSTRRNEKLYEWERDFPVNFQHRKSGLQTIFKLEFVLNDEDIELFKESINSKINGSLPIEIRIGRDNIPQIKVVEKRGKGGKALNGKSDKIAKFIGQNIIFNYIPAVRTDVEAMEVVKSMVAERMRELERKEEYIAAINTIRKIQEPILQELSDQIKAPLQEFLPLVNNVTVDIPQDRRLLSMRNDVEITIDDGTPTNLAYKGDGVKSLAALSLLKGRTSKTGASIIAIEEPESHLHPSAIHQLNEVIKSLGDDNQVVLTTHNPLFVDRLDIKSNILVDRGKAVPAKNTKAIRDVLGIKASDNLSNASYVLVVEGEDDSIALNALLPSLSDKLAKAIKSNLLVIQHIGGAGNLPYKLNLLRSSVCVYHTFLDNDDAGRTAYEKAESENLITQKNNTFVNCNGSPQSEFEDCLDISVYKEAVFNTFGVDLDSPKFKNNKKWSDRAKNVFLDQGKIWNDRTESRLKLTVAEAVSMDPLNALNKHKRNSIDALVNSLEYMLDTQKTD